MKRSGRLLRWVAAVVIVAVLVAGGIWAGWTVGSRGAVIDEQAAVPVDVAVTEQSFGRQFKFNATVTQERVPAAVNQLVGVVTYISPENEFSQGDTVYSVDDVPVRVVQGSKPFFRPLSRGIKGEDVRQLSQLLTDLGYLREADNDFGAYTEQAVLKYQKDLGLPVTGEIGLGQLVAVPILPQALFIDRKTAAAGAALSGGETIIEVPRGTPTFVLEVDEHQAAAIPVDATVTLRYDDFSWPAVITGSGSDPDTGNVLLFLEAPDGGVPCGSECAQLPASETLYIGADIQIVAPLTGPAVPLAAITTGADGLTTVLVVGADGTVTQTPVTVLTSQDGLAIVEGVQDGQVVRVFGVEGAAVPGTIVGTETDPSDSSQSE